MHIEAGFPNILSIHCRYCNRTLNEEHDILDAFGNRFVCSCGSPFSLHIKGEKKGNEFEHTAIVVSGEECSKYIDYSICYNGSTEHRILGVTNLGDNKLGVAVKGHTRVRCEPDSMWVVITGGWYGWNR